jgi:hypothetical protein
VLSKREPMKKRSPPQILADEHFNPPSAEQRSYRTLDGAFKPLLRKVPAMHVLRNDQKKEGLENNWIYSLICFGLCLLLLMLLMV